jgi:hypothetical protein
MPTDQQNNNPDSMHSASIFAPSPAPAKPDRATYEALRRGELDRIRLIDIKRRELLCYFCPLRIHEIDHLWDDEDISRDDKEEYNKAESDLFLSHRVLIHAVEGYLLGCVEYPVLTAEAALRRTTDTESLVDLLQAEEESMIRNFGPPWVDQPLPFSESCLSVLHSPGRKSLPTQGAAPSGTAIPWRWPWR